MKEMLNRKKGRAFRIMTALVMTSAMIELTGCQVFNRARSEYRKGMKAYEKNNYKEAAGYLKEAVKKEPESASYFIAYGMALTELGEYDEAQEQFNCAISDKDNKIVRQNNKKAYRMKGISFFRNNKYEDAVSSFEKALEIKELESLDVDILKYTGDAQCYLGKYEDAAKAYSDLIEKDGYKSSYYMKRAFAYGQAGDVDKAIEDYDKVVEKDSDDYDVYLQAYCLLSAAGEEDEACSYLNKALNIDKKGKESSYKKAIVAYYRGDTETALEGLGQAMEDGISEAGFYLARISYENKNYTKARTYLEVYLKEKSGTLLAEGYNLMGNCYLKEEEYEKALEQYQKGIKLNEAGTLKSLKENEVAAYEKLGDYDTAKEKADAFLEQYPEDTGMQKEVEFIKTRLL